MTRTILITLALAAGCDGTVCPSIEQRSQAWAETLNLQVNGVTCGSYECSLNTNNGVIAVDAWPTPSDACWMRQRLK